MLKNKTIAVVIPAFNEEKLIEKTIKTVPLFVDKIIVIDDKSVDNTLHIVKGLVEEAGDRIILIEHKENMGVGAAIVSGYKKALRENIFVTAVMAGDGQMNPNELEDLCLPIIDEGYSYVKGNRLIYGQAWGKIPKIRYLGNSGLSLLTKIASGYWHVADSQTGYTTISLSALKHIDVDKIYKRFGMPNDILVRLNAINVKVKEVPIEPIYNIGEKSGINYFKVFFSIPWLLNKMFFWRLWNKYVVRDFHPLVFFYVFGLILFPIGIIWGLQLVFYRLFIGTVAPTSALFVALLSIFGMQFLLFAMWFDMEYNKHLK